MNLVVQNPDIDPTKTKDEWEMSNFLMDMWVSVANNGFVTTHSINDMKSNAISY